MSDMKCLIKCPMCGEVLQKYGEIDPDTGTSIVLGANCRKCGIGDSDIKLWQELIRTRKALDVAVDAMKEQQRWFGVIRVSLISHLNNQYGTLFKSYDADPTVVNIKRANDMLNTAIKEITALEQKDAK